MSIVKKAIQINLYWI